MVGKAPEHPRMELGFAAHNNSPNGMGKAEIS